MTKENSEKENSISEEETSFVDNQLKKQQHDQDHKTGRILVLIGLILLLAGFVFTFLNIYYSKPVHLAMYGFTSAGLAVLFIGLYFIFN